MSIHQMFVLGIVAGLLLMATDAYGQKQKEPDPIAPAEALKEGWEEIDARLVFLMVRLANVEASLEATEKVIASKTRDRASRLSDAKHAERSNETMDRKGGGPVKWSEFYGRTAEKFFYHPTDRNTTYHTTTVLSQQSPQADNQTGDGIPSRQGLPVHQRPPQFDYIYKANRDAQARAEREAQELSGKSDALLARRQKLEAEQAVLWCQIAFRAVARYDLAKKPLYRFEPVAGADTQSRHHAEAIKSTAMFVRTALSIIDKAQQDQAAAFGGIKIVVSEAKEKLDDAFLRQEILDESATNSQSPAGRIAALAKHLKDVAENLSDSYEVSIEGDQAKDQLRKDTFRRLLQESLVNYAQTVLALDEMSVLMRDNWKIKPDLDKPLVFASLSYTRKSESIGDEEPKADIKAANPNLKIKPSRADIDALKDVDPIGNAIKGEWKKDSQNGIVGKGSTANKTWPRIALPVSIDGDYQLQAEFTRLAGV